MTLKRTFETLVGGLKKLGPASEECILKFAKALIPLDYDLRVDKQFLILGDGKEELEIILPSQKEWDRMQCLLDDWVLSQDHERGLFGSCAHRKGIPEVPYVDLKPEYTPIPGSCVVLVMAHCVAQMVCKEPTKKNEWQTREKELYDDFHELDAIVEKMLKGHDHE